MIRNIFSLFILYFFTSALLVRIALLLINDMTEKDRKTINMACMARTLDEVFGMEDIAETKEARQAIHDIAVRLYHKEERAADML